MTISMAKGVNIAARLQELAEPGGILISGTVYDLVRNKLSVGFDYLGQQPVKNVTEPVTSYRIVLDGEALPKIAAASVPLREAPAADSRRSDVNPQSLWARLWSRFRELPRPVRVVVAITLFLFAIDMFDGLDDIWFHWPAAAGALIVFLWMSLVGHKKRQ